MKRILVIGTLFCLFAFAPVPDRIYANPATIDAADTSDHEIVFDPTIFYVLFKGKTECATIEVLTGSFHFNVGGLAASGSLVETGGKIVIGFDNNSLNIHYKATSAHDTFRIGVN